MRPSLWSPAKKGGVTLVQVSLRDNRTWVYASLIELLRSSTY